jgi:hypothetical protein
MSARSLPDGEDVLAFIAGLGAGAWVSAVGTLEGVELAVARGPEETAMPVPGRVTLLSLSGPKTGPLMATVSRADSDGVRVFGGRLVKARVSGSAFVFAEGEGTESTPARAESTGTRARPGAAPGAEAKTAPSTAGSSPPAPSGSWASLAAMSEEPEDDEADEAPRYGDQVDHFVFGLCDVMVVKGERMKIRDVHGPGRLREIHIGAVKVLRPVERNGRRVFKLVKRG